MVMIMVTILVTIMVMTMVMIMIIRIEILVQVIVTILIMMILTVINSDHHKVFLDPRGRAPLEPRCRIQGKRRPRMLLAAARVSPR